jgi:hypothetical protein
VVSGLLSAVLKATVLWLYHSDARQVSDLSEGRLLYLSRSSTATNPSKTVKRKGRVAGKSETCRASEWQSHSPVVFRH